MISASISFCDSVIFLKFRRNIRIYREVSGNTGKHRYFGLKIKNINFFFLFFKFFSFFPIFFPYNKDHLYQWVRPTHLDDDGGDPDPRVATHAYDYGINVEKVLEKEVGVNVVASGSSNATTADSYSINKSSNDGSDRKVGKILESISTIHQVHYI